jgi:adenylate cyclase
LIGIGIETAVGTAGNLGAAQRFDYSVLGEPVAGAGWLQHEAPRYGADIVIGFETASAVRGCAVLELDLVRRPGWPAASPLYALLGDGSLERDPGFQALRAAHERLLAAFRARRWGEARELLDACLELDTRLTRLRTLYHRYAQRIAAGPSHALPEDWDGVWIER